MPKVAGTKTEGPGDVKVNAPTAYPEEIIRSTAEINDMLNALVELEDQGDLEAAAIKRYHEWLIDKDAEDPISPDE